MKIKLDPGAYMPTRAHDTDAGLDIRSPVRRIVWSRSREVIDTGVHVEIPAGYVGMMKSRSGMMCRCGVTSEGTIDAGYTGSIAVCLINTSDEPYTVEAGDKISQLVILPCLLADPEQVDEIASGDRGEKGFGSTGR